MTKLARSLPAILLATIVAGCAMQPGPREGEAGHLHFHARVPGRFLPCEGEVFGVTVDPAQVFVFAIGDTR